MLLALTARAMPASQSDSCPARWLGGAERFPEQCWWRPAPPVAELLQPRSSADRSRRLRCAKPALAVVLQRRPEELEDSAGVLGGDVDHPLVRDREGPVRAVAVRLHGSPRRQGA